MKQRNRKNKRKIDWLFVVQTISFICALIGLGFAVIPHLLGL